MNINETELKGSYIIEPEVFGDSRGWFMETWSKVKLPQIDVDFVQDNHSFSKEKGILRGIHCQIGQFAQAKLVRCVRGAIKDVAVDLRKDSPTFKKWIAVELSEENKKMLFIPKGFGHAFITLTENVEVIYKTDNYYNKESDRSIRFDDTEFNIDWGTKTPILSDKDKNAPTFSESDITF